MTAADLLSAWPLILAGLGFLGIAVAWVLILLSEYAMRRHYRRILDRLEATDAD